MCPLQDTFEARFARVVSLEANTPVVNAATLTKDESSYESSSEDDSDAVEREKQLAALQEQVLCQFSLVDSNWPCTFLFIF